MKDIDLKKLDPFAQAVVELRVPIKHGEVTIDRLTLRPPKAKDALAIDGKAAYSMAATLGLLEVLSGVPVGVLGEMCPEDAAEASFWVLLTCQRFQGVINLFDPEAGEDPTEAAGTPSPTSSATFAE